MFTENSLFLVTTNIVFDKKSSGATEAKKDEDYEKPTSSQASSGYRLGDGTEPSEFIPSRVRPKVFCRIF